MKFLFVISLILWTCLVYNVQQSYAGCGKDREMMVRLFSCILYILFVCVCVCGESRLDYICVTMASCQFLTSVIKESERKETVKKKSAKEIQKERRRKRRKGGKDRNKKSNHPRQKGRRGRSERKRQK